MSQLRDAVAYLCREARRLGLERAAAHLDMALRSLRAEDPDPGQ